MMSTASDTESEIKVWDIFVRVFHWALVATFLAAYLSGDSFMLIHVWAGYLVAGLVVLRIVWGFVGTRYARFSSFVYRPRKIVRYGRDILRLGGRRYIGHSPAGGAMVIALLVMIVLIVATGLLTLAAMEGSGPLAGYIATNRSMGRFWKGLHEFLTHVTLGLVLVHICGVLWASFVHGENLIRAMWNGRKRARIDR